MNDTIFVGLDVHKATVAVADAEARVERLTRQIEDLVPQWSMAPVAAEVGDFSRFDNPRQLMAYLGLVPSEHSSGATVRRGGITKAGNALARRARPRWW